MARFEDTFGARRPGGATGANTQNSGITGRGAPARGAGGRGRNDNTDNDDFVPAEFWINVGKHNANTNDQGEEIGFISLPGKGVALDQLKLPNPNSNSPYIQAQLDLWEQVMAFANKLEPGETVDLPLRLQLRRVGQETSVDKAANPFAVKLFEEA